MLNIPLKDHFRQTRVFNARLSIAASILLGLALLLALRLGYLQLFAHSHFATLSQANRIRPVPIPPVRGLILDRNGVVMASSFPVYTLEIVPEQVDDMDELIAQLGKLVTITEGDLKQFRKQLRERPRFEQLTLRTHLSDAEAATLAVQRPYLQGVELQARLQRHYPLGGLGVHAIGYVGRINEAEMERIDKGAYRGMRHIGKLGIEANYETPLLGQVGLNPLETNAHGRTVENPELKQMRVGPIAGKTLRLNLDAKLQAIVEEALGKRRGAVIAIDPRTGGVLAFVSTPTYDPNRFVNGIDSTTYRSLLDNPDKPLINRALNGQYAPGSTIKVFLGLAALENPESFDVARPIACPGVFNLPGDRHMFRDWKKTGHGVVGLREAIAQSCDVYFYRLAVALKIDGMKKFLEPFGFGEQTGVDIPGESKGILPSPEWKKARGLPWYPGETVMTGIGQGPILATPLQLAAAMGALANGGVRLKPRLVATLEDAKTKETQVVPTQAYDAIPLRKNENLPKLIEHMMAVAHSPGGTAYGIGWNAPYKIAGKTGTAQVKGIAQGDVYREHATPERFRDHALFISFAPVEDPQVAVAVIVENGGHGSSAAAPIARKVMDHVILGKQTAQPAVAPKSENDE
jgi:penicillin-binding protein 2